MVLTEDTFKEQDKYFSLFKDIVDDVSVKQYTVKEDGKIKDIDEKYIRAARSNENIEKTNLNFETKKIDPNAEIMKDSKWKFIYFKR